MAKVILKYEENHHQPYNEYRHSTTTTMMMTMMMMSKMCKNKRESEFIGKKRKST